MLDEEGTQSDVIRQLGGIGAGALPLARQVQLLEKLREGPARKSRAVDLAIIHRITTLRRGLEEARKSLDEAQALFESLTAPPLYPALFLATAHSEGGTEALVNVGGSVRVVSVDDGLDLSGLGLGREVLLGPQQNVIVSVSPFSSFGAGETAVFDRYVDEGRAIVRSREEEVMVYVADWLCDEELRGGDLVRWSQPLRVVLEKLERSDGDHLFLDATPTVTFADIGGLDAQISEIREELGLRLDHPDLALKYGLRPARAVLLVGPPGGGKTLIAQAVANWLASVSPSGRARFMNVKPSSLSSVWYSQSEANVREAFRVAREMGRDAPDVPVVMFFDEVDSLAATRGLSHMRVDDRVLNAFLAELDGLEPRGNVVVVAATNRRDVLDAAAVREGRLGDLLIEIPRPGRDAARAIFDKHLDPGAPYAAAAASPGGPAARQEIIDAVVSRVYAPNGMGALARIRLMDGTERVVTGRDLMSGALIANVARLAKRRTAFRERTSGEEGIRESDLLEAVEAELEKTARTLTSANSHQFIDDLPAEARVAGVEPVVRRVRREHRYLTVA